jgi:hypothetical protein
MKIMQILGIKLKLFGFDNHTKPKSLGFGKGLVTILGPSIFDLVITPDLNAQPDPSIMGLTIKPDPRIYGASCVQSFSFFSTKSAEEMKEKRAPN